MNYRLIRADFQTYATFPSLHSKLDNKPYMLLFRGGYVTLESGVTFHYYTPYYLGNNRAVVNRGNRVNNPVNVIDGVR